MCKINVELKRKKLLLPQQDSDLVIGVSVVQDHETLKYNEDRPSQQVRSEGD